MDLAADDVLIFLKDAHRIRFSGIECLISFSSEFTVLWVCVAFQNSKKLFVSCVDLASFSGVLVKVRCEYLINIIYRTLFRRIFESKQRQLKMKLWSREKINSFD